MSWLCALAVAAAGCQGYISDAPSSGDGASNDGSGSPAGANGRALCGEEMSFADETPLRLLTRTQYNNAIADLFGIDSAPMRVTVEATGDLYDNNAAGLNPTASATEHYEEIAPQIAAQAMASGVVALECPETDCVRALVVREGRRIFRRPVDEAEVAALMGLYAELRGPGIGDTPAQAVEGLVTAMLQMPGFLYRVELGPEDAADGIVSLTGFEVASRLSFFLWNSTPPGELLDAAEAGELDAPEGVERWAGWLLDHESGKARGALSRFTEQWLGVEQVPIDRLLPDPELYPDFSPELARSMRQETLALVEHLTFDTEGTFGDAFDADYTFADQRLAALYGIDGVDGDEQVRVSTDPNERSGVLTHAGVLAVRSGSEHGNPIARGVFVARDVLCIGLGAPPAGVPPLEEEVVTGGTLRDELELHSRNPCAGCHKVIDPLGLSLENYDAIGAFRTADEGGNAVDATGELEIDGELVAFDNARELSTALATSSSVRECVTRRLLEYGVGRSMRRDEDKCLAATVSGDEHQSIRTTVMRIVTSDTFRLRRRPTTEACR